MTEYTGKDEHSLRTLLDDCSSFEERRKIRAAIRLLKDGSQRSHSFSVKSSTGDCQETDIIEAVGQFRRPKLGVTKTSTSGLIISDNRSLLTACNHTTDSLLHSTFPCNSEDITAVAPHNSECHLGSRQSAKELHQPVIKSLKEEHGPLGNLTSLRESLNSAFLKTVTKSQSKPLSISESTTYCTQSKSNTDLAHLKDKYLRDKDCVPNISQQSMSDNVSNGNITNGRSSSNSPSKSMVSHGSSEDITRWRSASYSSEPIMNLHSETKRSSIMSAVLEDTFIDNCYSEPYLQQLLVKSTDFVERRKLRTRIRHLRDFREKLQYGEDEVEEGEARKNRSGEKLKPEIKKEVSLTKDSLQLDYDKIETLEEFKTLLTLTDDHDEKRKIRNAMRQLRRRLEIEKVKLSAGSKVLKSDSRRHQSKETTQLLKDQEQNNGSRIKNVAVKSGSDPRPRIQEPPFEVQFSVRTSVGSNKPISGEKSTSIIPLHKGGLTSAKTTDHVNANKPGIVPSKTEDFLSNIKTRLSTQDKRIGNSGRGNKLSDLSYKSRDSNTDKSKINVALTRSGVITQPSGERNPEKSVSLSASSGIDKTRGERSLSGKFLSSDTRKVKETQSVKSDEYRFLNEKKTEPTFKSSLSVKLNSRSKASDSKGRLYIDSKPSTDSKKRNLPYVEKLSKDKVNIKQKNTCVNKVERRQPKLSDSSETLLNKTKDGVDIELSSTVKTPADFVEKAQDIPRKEELVGTTSPSVTTTAPTTTTSSRLSSSSKPDLSSVTVSGDSLKDCHKAETSKFTGGTLTSESTSNFVKKEAFNQYVFRIDLKPKSKGLSRSHSDILPQTRSSFKISTSTECPPLRPLESRLDMEKAFLDMLDDMDHHSTTSDTKLSDVSDDDLDANANMSGNSVDEKRVTANDMVVANGNKHMEQRKSWILLHNVKEDLSAVKVLDGKDGKEEMTIARMQDGHVNSDKSACSEDPKMNSSDMTDDEEAFEENNKNSDVLEKLTEDITDNLARHVASHSTDMQSSDQSGQENHEGEGKMLVSVDAVPVPQAGEKSVTYLEEEDGTLTFQRVSKSDNQDRVVTVRSKMYRTLSNAQAEEQDTIVETNFTSPGGTQLKERDVIRTKNKITSRGSNYYQRSIHVTRRVKDKEGGEVVEQDLCVESDNNSVSQGESWGNRVVTKMTLDQPRNLQSMLKEKYDVPKKSHTTLVLNKLNVSKTSSGYGSVSGSEEEDREEYVDIKQARPKGCPEITATLQDIVVKEGDTFVMECGAKTDPSLAVTWYVGSDQIDTDNDHYHIDYDKSSGKSSLTIYSAKDSGLFRCVFRNQHGEAETKTTVTVQKKPQNAPVIVSGLQNMTVTEGHSITLACKVTDAESVTWYKDNFVQHHTADFKQSYDGDIARLEIGEVFLDDAGEYACVARNRLGGDRSACHITVTACGSETSVVPMFLTQMDSSTLTVGDKLMLECDVIGSPEPDISWNKDGQPIREDCSYNQMYDGRTAKLEIEDIQIKDSGKYKCIAANEAGQVSSEARITVKVGNEAPSVTVPLSDVKCMAGKSAVLLCQMTGFPQPTIVWRKNGMLIGQTKDFKLSFKSNRARLEICGACPSDSGQYECVAKNGFGETSTSCLLTVTETSTPSVKSVSDLPAIQSTPIMRTSTPSQSITELNCSSSQKSYHSSLILSETPGSATVPQNIINKALTQSTFQAIDSVPSPVISPSSSQPCQMTGSAVSRSESARVTSPSATESSSVMLPSASADVTQAQSPHTDNKSETPASPAESKNIMAPESVCTTSSRSAPQNTIGKFLALAAARELKQTPTVALRTTLDSPTESHSSPVTPTHHRDIIQSTPNTTTQSADIMRATTSKPSAPTQPLSKVQLLRLQFLGEAGQSQSGKPNSTPIRRWHSLPPQDLRPTVAKREKYQEPGGGQHQRAIMPSYDDINDEEELMKIMGKTDDFDERKKIRARLKEVREKDKLEREARRQQREKEAGDVVKQKFEKAEEDKKRRMQQYSDMAAKPGVTQTTETKTAGDGSKITTTTTTSSSKEKTEDGGTRTQTVKKTETTITKTSGIGGVQYAKPGAEETARKLSHHLQTESLPGTSGRISVKSESWNSRDGITKRSEKTESWGAKPGGARGAMAAFKQMDATNSPAQPNAGRGRGMTRSPSAIKQMLLEWCKSKTKEYENIEITNFSSCWNNGLAFCALIHHFFPDAFDYKALSPKNRRYNFDLAFDTAEKMADIAPLLDTDDMVRMKNPDWKCVFTYVQSIYRHLRDHDANKAKEQEQ